VESGLNGNPAALRSSSPVQDGLDDGVPDLPCLASVGDVHTTVEVVDDGSGAGANCGASLDRALASIRFRRRDIDADLNERPLTSGPEALRRVL
jgi:hypothetical protein